VTACTTAPVLPTSTPTPTLIPNPAPTPTPAFDASKYGTAELDVTYCTPDGKPQKLDLYFPESGGPWPVLLYVHGGSWREGDKAEGAGWRNLTASGYLIVAVNYRMAAEAKFPAMINDVDCAVRFLRAHHADYNVDTTHIGALGASAGGHLVALLGTSPDFAGREGVEYADQSSRVQAVVTLAGLSDFTVDMPDGINMAIYYAFGGLAGTESEKNIAASPVTYITPDDPPFLILHGDKDGVVPVEQAKILHAALTEAGVPSQLGIVENGDHGLQGKNATPTQEEIFNLIFAFLEANLK